MSLHVNRIWLWFYQLVSTLFLFHHSWKFKIVCLLLIHLFLIFFKLNFFQIRLPSISLYHLFLLFRFRYILLHLFLSSLSCEQIESFFILTSLKFFIFVLIMMENIFVIIFVNVVYDIVFFYLKLIYKFILSFFLPLNFFLKLHVSNNSIFF